MTAMLTRLDIFKRQTKAFFNDNFAKIIEINRKYSTPRVEMSRAVRFSLLMLRVYLLVLVGLLAYKFITLVR